MRKNSEDTADVLAGVLETDLEMVEESDSCKEELEDVEDKEDKKEGQLLSFADRTEQEDEGCEHDKNKIDVTGNSQPDHRLLE